MVTEHERVLVADPMAWAALRTAEQVVVGGGEAIVVTTAAAAMEAQGVFDRAVFAFDLPDGSGIVLAAEMMLDARVAQIGFSYPDADVPP